MKINTTLLAVISIIPFFFFGCNNKTHTNEAVKKMSYQSLKGKEDSKIQKVNPEHNENIKKKKRELRYLYFANGGIQAFFDDGTVVGCPRCEFCRSNIIQMFNKKPFEKYTVENDGSLLVNGNNKEIPVYNSSAGDGWALINYKWYIKPPQY